MIGPSRADGLDSISEDSLDKKASQALVETCSHVGKNHTFATSVSSTERDGAPFTTGSLFH